MKYFISAICAFFLVACGASSNASKLDAFAVDAAAELPVYSGLHVWNANREDSKLEFIATHNSRQFTGTFENFAVAIQLDPETPESGKIEAAIDLASADAGDRDRNANLPAPEWFHTAKFPLATFSSEKISSIGGDNFEAEGKLRIKGISKTVKLVFSLQVDGDTALAIGGTDLNRQDFNLGEGPDFETEDWVKFPVEIKFNIAATK